MQLIIYPYKKIPNKGDKLIMKKLFFVLLGLLGISAFCVPSQAEVMKRCPMPHQLVMESFLENVEFLKTSEGMDLADRLVKVTNLLKKELPKNNKGGYDRQNIYFFHQDLLARMEELNKAYVKAHKKQPKDTAQFIKLMREYKVESPVLGRVTLLEVINKLDNFDWNSMGNVTVHTKELEKALSAK